MLSLSVQKTDNVISRILSHKCNYALIYLRLYKNSSYRNLVDRACNEKTLNALHRFPKRCNHFVHYRRYSTETLGKKVTDIASMIYQVSEHTIFHNMLKESVHYEKTIMPPIKTKAKVSYEEICRLYTTEWSVESALNIYDAIKTISYSHLNGCRFEISLYDNILEACVGKLHELNNLQLKTLMQHVIVLNNVYKSSDSRKSFYNYLDNECLKRFYPADTQTSLLISDAFYQLEFYHSNYMWRALRKIGTRPAKLSAKNLVQLLFYMCHTTLHELNMFEVECRFEECINELSGNEIGIIARGFFLNKRKLYNKFLMNKLIGRVKENIQSIDSTALASIMKLIRYSDCNHCLEDFNNLLKSLRSEIPRLSLQCLIHIAHCCGATRVYDETLMKMILERTRNEIKATRMKDIERILFAIYSIAPRTNYYQEIYQFLVNEVALNYQTSRLVEVNMFPISLVRITTFATFRNIYIPHLLQHVFDSSFIQHIHKRNMKSLTNDLFRLQCTVQILFPYHKGPFLDEKMYSYLLKQFLVCDEVQKIDRSALRASEIMFLCKNNLGIDVYLDRILPHEQLRDMVFGIDEHNNSIEVESILSSMPVGSIKYVNSEELKKINWYALLLVNRLAKVLGHRDYAGFVYTRIAELKILGYTPLMIYEEDWILLRREEDKINYLKRLIYENRFHRSVNC